MKFLPQTKKRAVIVSKHGDNDVAGEHGDGGFLPWHDALLVIPAGAPVETPGSVVSHLNDQRLIFQTNNQQWRLLCQWGKTGGIWGEGGVCRLKDWWVESGANDPTLQLSTISSSLILASCWDDFRCLSSLLFPLVPPVFSFTDWLVLMPLNLERN